MPNARVNIGLVQNSCSSDIEANLAAAIRGIREAAARGANIVCLQELFLSVLLHSRFAWLPVRLPVASLAGRTTRVRPFPGRN